MAPDWETEPMVNKAETPRAPITKVLREIKGFFGGVADFCGCCGTGGVDEEEVTAEGVAGFFSSVDMSSVARNGQFFRRAVQIVLKTCLYAKQR